jgi:hypothetical protein
VVEVVGNMGKRGADHETDAGHRRKKSHAPLFAGRSCRGNRIDLRRVRRLTQRILRRRFGWPTARRERERPVAPGEDAGPWRWLTSALAALGVDQRTLARRMTRKIQRPDQRRALDEVLSASSVILVA